MDKAKIKKNYLKKIKAIKKHDNLYHAKSQPIITDSEYDKLKNEIFALEKKYDYLKDKESPSKK